MGISAASIVEDLEALRAQTARLVDRYRQPVLAERYIRGREVTVGVLGNLTPRAARRLSDRTAPHVLPAGLTCFPPLEVDMSAYATAEAGLYTSRIKVELAESFHYICPANLEDELVDRLGRLSAAAFRVMGCCDVARVDFRLDAGNGDAPTILEINPLPGLNPDYSDLPLEAYAAGWSYRKLIGTLVDLSLIHI